MAERGGPAQSDDNGSTGATTAALYTAGSAPWVEFRTARPGDAEKIVNAVDDRVKKTQFDQNNIVSALGELTEEDVARADKDIADRIYSRVVSGKPVVTMRAGSRPQAVQPEAGPSTGPRVAHNDTSGAAHDEPAGTTVVSRSVSGPSTPRPPGNATELEHPDPPGSLLGADAEDIGSETYLEVAFETRQRTLAAPTPDMRALVERLRYLADRWGRVEVRAEGGGARSWSGAGRDRATSVLNHLRGLASNAAITFHPPTNRGTGASAAPVQPTTPRSVMVWWVAESESQVAQYDTDPDFDFGDPPEDNDSTLDDHAPGSGHDRHPGQVPGTSRMFDAPDAGGPAGDANASVGTASVEQRAVPRLSSRANSGYHDTRSDHHSASHGLSGVDTDADDEASASSDADSSMEQHHLSAGLQTPSRQGSPPAGPAASSRSPGRHTGSSTQSDNDDEPPASGEATRVPHRTQTSRNCPTPTRRNFEVRLRGAHCRMPPTTGTSRSTVNPRGPRGPATVVALCRSWRSAGPDDRRALVLGMDSSVPVIPMNRRKFTAAMCRMSRHAARGRIWAMSSVGCRRWGRVRGRVRRSVIPPMTGTSRSRGDPRDRRVSGTALTVALAVLAPR